MSALKGGKKRVNRKKEVQGGGKFNKRPGKTKRNKKSAPRRPAARDGEKKNTRLLPEIYVVGERKKVTRATATSRGPRGGGEKGVNASNRRVKIATDQKKIVREPGWEAETRRGLLKSRPMLPHPGRGKRGPRHRASQKVPLPPQTTHWYHRQGNLKSRGKPQVGV